MSLLSLNNERLNSLSAVTPAVEMRRRRQREIGREGGRDRVGRSKYLENKFV